MNHRPRLSVEFSPLHKKLFFASLGLVMFTWAYTLISILRLPDTIASHFNANGIPDDFSSKHYIWFVPVLASIMFFSLNYLARFPHQFNYLKKITPANAQHETIKRWRWCDLLYWASVQFLQFYCMQLFNYLQLPLNHKLRFRSFYSL